MGTYVVGDLHGHYNEWITMKERIEQEDANAKFIIVGDTIDRGVGTLELIDWCKANITPDGKYQLIMGNHEYMKLGFWTKKMEELYQEYKVTKDEKVEQHILMLMPMDQYLFTFLYGNDFERFRDDLAYFSTLPYYKDITVTTSDGTQQRYIIAHATIPITVINEDGTLKSIDELSDAEKSDIVWNRGVKDFTAIPDAILINGHTPTVMPDAYEDYSPHDNSGKVIIQPHRYNIDCGLAYRHHYPTANLAIMRLEDKKIYYLY